MRNETLEGVEEISGEDDRGVHFQQPADDEDPDPTLLQDIDQRLLEEIAGIVHDEKGEDVEVVEPGSKEDKDKTLLRTSPIYPMCQQGRPKMVLSTGMILERQSSLMLVEDHIQSVKMDSGR